MESVEAALERMLALQQEGAVVDVGGRRFSTAVSTVKKKYKNDVFIHSLLQVLPATGKTIFRCCSESQRLVDVGAPAQPLLARVRL